MDVNQLFRTQGRIGSRVGPRGGSRRLRVTVATMFLAASFAGVSACSSGSTSGGGGGAKGTTLSIAVPSFPSLNPAESDYTLYWGAMFSTPAYAALFHVTAAGKITPELAKSWHYVNSTSKPRNEVFEFKLRSDAKFSDGTSVTAKSVVQWLTYFVHAKGLYSGDLGPNPRFTALGPLKVKIQMTQPNPSLPLILSDQGNNIGLIGSPEAAAHPKKMESGTYGAGPYMLQASNTVNGDHYTYVPNPYYYDKAAIHFKKVYIKVIANPSTRLQAQESGQYDVTLGAPSTASAAKKAGLQVKSAPQGMIFLALDQKHDVGAPQLRDLKVRRAINYAINRKAIAKALFGRIVHPVWGFLTQDVDTGPHNVHYAYDPAKAKRLLTQAGYAKGFTLTVVCPSYYGNFGTPMLNAVGKYLAAVGIRLDLKCFPDEGSFSAEVFKYKLAVIHSLGIYGNTASTYPLYLKPGSALNFFGDDKVIDRLYHKGATSSDPSIAWGKMWHRYTSQAYSVPLVSYPGIYYISKGIGGVIVTGKHYSALPSEMLSTGK